MASSTTKFKVSSLFQPMFFSILTGFFLIGCGGDNSNDVSTTGSSDYIISFYDENLDFVDTAQNIKNGTWYEANKSEPFLSNNLNSDIRLYAVPNVVEITTQEELAAINVDDITRAGKYILMNDINLDETGAGFEGDKGWESIGSNYDNSFTGILNGDFHRITNLWINRPDEREIGFFGYVQGGNIRNLGIVIAEDKEVRGESYVGGIAGMAKFAYNADYIPVVIINSYVIGNINGEGHVGGIAGMFYGEAIAGDENYIYSGAYITNSYFVGNVIGIGECIGGIAGMNNGNISNTYTIGNISNAEYWTGGITGMSYLGSVTNSYSLANISGDDIVAGGITGYAYLASTFQYNAAINPYIGGIRQVNRIAGDISSSIGKFSDNFAFDDMDITPIGINDNRDIGYEGYNGIDKTLAELQTQETYSNLTANGGLGWKFGNDNNNPWVWGAFDDYPYPTFYWQSERP